MFFVDPIMQLGDVWGRALRARCEELAGMVGLPVNLLDRLPHQLSGGQKARGGIARAIESVLGNPQDAYTRELLMAIPYPPLPVH